MSIAGFGLRGYWMAFDNPLLQHRAAKVLPHMIDTLLLVSAIVLLVILHLSPPGATLALRKNYRLVAVYRAGDGGVALWPD